MDHARSNPYSSERVRQSGMWSITTSALAVCTRGSHHVHGADVVCDASTPKDSPRRFPESRPEAGVFPCRPTTFVSASFPGARTSVATAAPRALQDVADKRV